MIVARAPLRISFIDESNGETGRAIAAAVDKFVYVAVNKNLRNSNNVLVKYSITEEVPRPQNLKHTRIRAALLDLGIGGGIEIASLADISARSGLGSSSSFTVALLKALNVFLGKNLSKQQAAEMACRLEREILKEPICKQDQYIPAFGGLNILTFNRDGSVKVEPVLIDFKKKSILEKHLLIFFTGSFGEFPAGNSKRPAAGLVYPFRDAVLSGDMKKAGEILNQIWQSSGPAADQLYAAGISAGAFGGKILKNGNCGSILFLAPPERHAAIIQKLKNLASENKLAEFTHLPIKLVECGVDTLFRGNYKNGGLY